MANKREREAAQEARNEKLMTSIELYVAQCGGDVNKATPAQKEQFADALASWVITSDTEADEE